jgi:hypothetical protein
MATNLPSLSGMPVFYLEPKGLDLWVRTKRIEVMALKMIAFGAGTLCLMSTASADDMIYNGLHCNSLCQWAMGISPEHPMQKRGCAQIVSHSAQYDADLVQLCKFVSGRPYR